MDKKYSKFTFYNFVSANLFAILHRRWTNIHYYVVFNRNNAFIRIIIDFYPTSTTQTRVMLKFVYIHFCARSYEYIPIKMISPLYQLYDQTDIYIKFYWYSPKSQNTVDIYMVRESMSIEQNTKKIYVLAREKKKTRWENETKTYMRLLCVQLYHWYTYEICNENVNVFWNASPLHYIVYIIFYYDLDMVFVRMTQLKMI